MNSNIYIPAEGPDNFRAFLADPDKQWKSGYSARALAYSGCEAAGFPMEIPEAFEASDTPQAWPPNTL